MILGRRQGERKRAAMVRERAAASGLGEEVRLIEEKAGQAREGKVLGFFEKGFILAGPFGFFEVVTWRNVVSVTRRPPNEVVVARAGPTGRQIVFDARQFERWTGVSGAEVIEFVTAEVERFNAGVTAAAREESVHALEAVRDGRRVELGVFEVDAEGIYPPVGDVLRWADLTRVVRVGNVVELYTAAARHQPAMYVPERDVPDVELFLEMATEVHHVRTTRQLPIETAEPPESAVLADSTRLEQGTLTPPHGAAEDMLAKAEEKGLSGTPRWYTARRGTVPLPERGVLALYGDGFAHSWGRKASAYHWDDVSVTTPTLSSPPSGGSNGIVFVKPEHRAVLSNRTFHEVTLHAERLTQAHARFLLDRAVEAFVEGTQASFGEVTVTREGFEYDDRSVPWSAVSGVRAGAGDDPRRSNDLVVELADGQEPVTIAFGDLANGEAFTTLVGMMARQ